MRIGRISSSVRSARGLRLMCSFSSRSSAVSIAWFRVGDLRIDDHEPLLQSAASSRSVIPLFCLDDSLLSPTTADVADTLLSLPSTGPHRLAALLEGLRALQASLRILGSDLLSCTGSTAAAVSRIVSSLQNDGENEERDPFHPRSLALHYYPAPGDLVATKLEAAVVSRFREAAEQRGWQASVHAYAAGPFTYHPQDICSSLCQDALNFQETEGSPLVNSKFHSNQGESNGEALRGAMQILAVRPTMTEFRKAVQQGVPVRRPLPAPKSLPPLHAAFVAAMNLPGHNLLTTAADTESVRALYAAAGALEALERLETLAGRRIDPYSPSVPSARRPPVTPAQVDARLERLFTSNSNPYIESIMDNYRESRFMAAGADTSAMLSAALSLGTLSPRALFWAAVGAMQGRYRGSSSTPTSVQVEEGAGGERAGDEAWDWEEPTKESHAALWLLMHLGIRDFFLYCAAKDGEALFSSSGPRREKDSVAWSRDEALLSFWAQGRTGFPFVDANLRELAATGWMSNRGRQNVASFLTKGLGLDWRMGAELFQALLVDHDAGVNRENWAYIAGAGRDPRGERFFRTVTQGEKYDPAGELAQAWIPELAGVGNKGDPEESAVRRYLHRPWEASEEISTLSPMEEQEGKGEKKGYPAPVIDPASQIGKVPKKR